MSNQFVFVRDYFKNTEFISKLNDIRIEVNEQASFDFESDEYHLRIVLQTQSQVRNVAIEHHPKQTEHNLPHLQFKLKAEGFGVIYVDLALLSQEEYRQAILGFIYKTKSLFRLFEDTHPGITAHILHIDRVDTLELEGRFFDEKISQAFIEIRRERESADFHQLRHNSLLLTFLGADKVQELILQKLSR